MLLTICRTTVKIGFVGHLSDIRKFCLWESTLMRISIRVNPDDPRYRELARILKRGQDRGDNISILAKNLMVMGLAAEKYLQQSPDDSPGGSDDEESGFSP